MHHRIGLFIFYTFIMAMSPCAALAQDFFADLAAPKSNPVTTLRFSASDEPVIRGDRDVSHIDQQKFYISTPINYVPTDPANVSWKWSQMNLSPGLQLPGSAKMIPSRLYESEYGLSYKHSDSDSEFWGASISFGSASDKTFNSKDNSTLGANIFYSQSTDPTGRWIWLVNYSNNRSFANEIPIPGFAYLYTPSKQFIGVFGFPFAFLRIQLNEMWSTNMFFGPYVYKVEVSKVLWGPFQAFALTDSTLQNYYLDNRDRKEDRLFVAENKALIGVKGPMSRELYAEFSGGLAFNRSISQSSNYKIDKSDALLLENRWFIASQISARF